MASAKLHLSLNTPFEQILDEAVTMVIADTDAGQVTILPEHASLMGSISAGKLEVRLPGHVKDYFVRQAILDMDNKTGVLKIMALQAEPTHDIEMTSIREHLQNVEADLANGEKLSEMRYRYLQNEKLAVEKTIEAAKEK